MSSFQCSFHLPIFPRLFMVPCIIVLANPDEQIECLYHLSVHCWTVVKNHHVVHWHFIYFTPVFYLWYDLYMRYQVVRFFFLAKTRWEFVMYFRKTFRTLSAIFLKVSPIKLRFKWWSCSEIVYNECKLTNKQWFWAIQALSLLKHFEY